MDPQGFEDWLVKRLQNPEVASIFYSWCPSQEEEAQLLQIHFSSVGPTIFAALETCKLDVRLLADLSRDEEETLFALLNISKVDEHTRFRKAVDALRTDPFVSAFLFQLLQARQGPEKPEPRAQDMEVSIQQQSMPPSFGESCN